MNRNHLPRLAILVTLALGCSPAGPAVSPVAPAATQTTAAPSPTATAVAATATPAAVASPSPEPECWAGPDETWLAIDAKSNIFGAGLTIPPAPGGGGEGLLPPVVELPVGGTRIVRFSCTAGLTDCCTNPPMIGAEGYKQPTDVESAGGISGLKAHLLMFLAGVFLGDNPPAEPAPERLDFTDGTHFKRLEPELGQTFYIGDGKGQDFVAPDRATRLYLGFVDGYFAAGPPGWYDNNRGALEATVRIDVE